MMSSRLILRWVIDGTTRRDVRMWIPEGDNGARIYDLAHRLLGVLVGISDVEYLAQELAEENNND